MPEIEITPEQEERLRALQEDIARDVVGKYGHVRPRDAVEYLLDRYEDDEGSDDPVSDAESSSETDDEGDAVDADDEATGTDDEGDAVDAADEATGTDAATARAAAEEDGDAADGGGDAMLNEMMSLLDTHSDKWGESSGDERYQVDLPDGSTEQVRTKDDVKALLFKHYR